MQLRDRITTALTDAMRAKEADRLSTLRLINAAIKDRDIAMRGTADEAAGLSDADVLAIMGRMVKQRQESARAYEEGGRLELAEKELAEIKVIEEFLPRQLSDAEAESAVDAAIAAVGATSIRDMGKVMAELKTKYTGQMDFAKAGPMVKSRLGLSRYSEAWDGLTRTAAFSEGLAGRTRWVSRRAEALLGGRAAVYGVVLYDPHETSRLEEVRSSAHEAILEAHTVPDADALASA